MRLDKLQLDLYPRPAWQAVDLGFSLLRLAGATTYVAWLALWLPLVALCYGLTLLSDPKYGMLWLILSWWLRPLLERVVIFVLSRAVFGEKVSAWAALRAWPRQLGGGWFRLLTLWRPFMPGRGLYQPVWQLEHARGSFAATRRRVLARDGAGRTAYWFGLVCAHFEMVLQLGMVSLISLFFAQPDAVNPFTLLMSDFENEIGLLSALSYLVYAIAGGIIGPIYTACCFTLYLNRRAELEAWDIELVLRQLKPHPATSPGPSAKAGLVATLLLPLALCGLLLQPAPSHAAEAPAATETINCTPPKEVTERQARRGTPVTPQQAHLRQQLDQIYTQPELRSYRCDMVWEAREKKDEKPEESKTPSWLEHLFGDGKGSKLPEMSVQMIKLALILGALVLVAWLLYRYRDRLAGLLQPPTRDRAPLPAEVAGMDIRPESLPDDVPSCVRTLWRDGQQRVALALLYRASLSQLAHRHQLALNRGATEGDCLRLAETAAHQGELPTEVLKLLREVTGLWQGAAYARLWPTGEILEITCGDWARLFGQGRPS